MVNLASDYVCYRYGRITAMLRREGWRVNQKRVERLWRRKVLKVPARQPKPKRLWLGDGFCVRLRPALRNHGWCYDFVHAQTHDGRPLRFFTLMDEFTRECLTSAVAKKMTSENVLERLSDLFIDRGVPGYLRSATCEATTVRSSPRPRSAGVYLGRGGNTLHRAGKRLRERLH